METMKLLPPETRTCTDCTTGFVVPYRVGPHWHYPRRCPACADRIYRQDILRQREIDEKFQQALIEWHIAAVIPRYFWSAAVVTLPEALQDKIDSLPADKGLFLFGPVGCGKTYALAAIARRRIESKLWPVEFENWERLLYRLRICYGGKAGQAERQIEQMMKAKAAFLDDLSIGGSESDFALKTLYTILDYRIENGLPTFFSANRDPDQIGQAYDQRIASRIRGHCQIIHYAGKDRRIQGAVDAKYGS